MKKILFLLPLILILFSSCEKEDASKDVDNCIKKLELFNNTFDKFYADSIISVKAMSEKDISEYDQLKKISTEYYESMNKINDNIAEEKKKKAAGDKIDGYEAAYQKYLTDNKARIDEATNLFISNLKVMQK